MIPSLDPVHPDDDEDYLLDLTMRVQREVLIPVIKDMLEKGVPSTIIDHALLELVDPETFELVVHEEDDHDARFDHFKTIN